jgi:hypothetical protein
MPLTDDEEDEIRQILLRAQNREKETAYKSKRGFFSWLRSTSLGWLVAKLLDWAWITIKKIFLLF